jgi:hypothetical protein
VLALALCARPDHASPSLPAVRAESLPPSRPPKADEKPKAQNAADLKALQQVFGNKPVTILGSSPVEGAQITDVVEVFGKQYLQVQKKDDKPMLIRTDLITAIRDD